MKYYRKSSDLSWVTCLVCIVTMAIYLALCGWSVNYLLQVFNYTTIPWFWAEVIGLIGGSVTVPVAVIIVILRWLGVGI